MSDTLEKFPGIATFLFVNKIFISIALNVNKEKMALPLNHGIGIKFSNILLFPTKLCYRLLF